MESSETIAHNLEQINRRIDAACQKAGRARDEVKLLLATKTVSPERIQTAIEAGCTLLGENKIQEVKEKYEALKPFPHQMHFIGHLQSNKIKEILRYEVDCVESVDRLSLAQKLSERLQREGRELDILVQVNTSGEESKFGVAPEKAIDLCREIAALPGLHIKGLMTIGLFSSDMDKVRACFQKLRSLRDEINQLALPGVEMRELSMGMSGDLEVAIEEGATIIRVGTAVFGPRIYADSYYWNEQSRIEK